MKHSIVFKTALVITLAITACVPTKKFTAVQNELNSSNADLTKALSEMNSYKQQLAACESSEKTSQKQIEDLREQLADCKQQRDKGLEAVGGLTVLSQGANENMKETLMQLERKDKYIHLLQAARSKADSLNLALAVNLTSVLKEGIEDKDIEVKVDKTVVFINLSDKMLFKSGSFKLTDQAFDVLGKIAAIVQSRPGVEVMVEGYTDNDPIKKAGIEDNWDLSVKRSTSVVRALQTEHNVDPNRLVAAGRGEYNTLASNETEEGKSINRRTRIILLPKLDQMYEMLNPNNVPD